MWNELFLAFLISEMMDDDWEDEEEDGEEEIEGSASLSGWCYGQST